MTLRLLRMGGRRQILFLFLLQVGKARIKVLRSRFHPLQGAALFVRTGILIG